MKLIFFILSLNLFAQDPAHRPQFEKKTIKVGNTKILVELADTREKQAYGLMFRQSLKDGEGMLFVFQDEEVRNFWMKNTFIDLSIAYISSNKKIIKILDMAATKSEMESFLSTYSSETPAQYALEVPKGWFLRNKIKLGDKLVLK